MNIVCLPPTWSRNMEAELSIVISLNKLFFIMPGSHEKLYTPYTTIMEAPVRENLSADFQERHAETICQLCSN